jgi:hypothetical protein
MWIEGVSIMITGYIHQLRQRASVRTTQFAAGLFAVLALGVAVFAHLPTAYAYDHDYYAFCTGSLGQTPRVCCTNADGVWSNGDCVEPAALPTPLPTITQQVIPPVVVAPAP